MKKTALIIAMLLPLAACLEGGVRLAGDELPDDVGGATDLAPPPNDRGGGAEDARPTTDAMPPPPDVGPPQRECEPGAVRCGADKVSTELCAEGRWVSSPCPPQWRCEQGKCIPPECEPKCGFAQCGPDGCGGICGVCPDDATCNDKGICVELPTFFRAVVVVDLWDGVCSPYGSSGADIRGARLRNSSNQLLGFFEQVEASVGQSDCINNYQDPEDCAGPPGQSFVALNGGFVVGSFAGQQVIESGYQLRVFELDQQVNGTAEPYEIWLATDLECPFDPARRDSCMKLLTDQALGSTTVVIP